MSFETGLEKSVFEPQFDFHWKDKIVFNSRKWVMQILNRVSVSNWWQNLQNLSVIYYIIGTRDAND